MKTPEIPATLTPGDAIGIVSPSWLATEKFYAPVFAELERLGFQVKTGPNFYAASWGYAASPQERAADINQMILDDSVRMIFFSGGEGADEVIPLIDYAAAKAHPKLWLGFSDGTSILNAVHSRTGLPVWYGMQPNFLVDASDYNRAHFLGHMVRRDMKEHLKAAPWHTLTPGKAQGELCGGYLDNFTYLAHSGWAVPEPGQDYLLFLEEHQMFFCVEHVSDELGRLEASPIFRQAKGLLFGQYSDEPNGHLLNRLRILGERWGIPVAYCHDFGHSQNHAILPIGLEAVLDTQAQTLTYLQP